MKHTAKKTAGLLLFLIGFFTIWKGLNYALFDDTESYNRFSFREFYTQKSIDTLFAGSSHSWVSVNPVVMDRELMLNAFNVGRDTQTLDGSLLVIQEAVRRHPIRHIYLELFYGLGYEQREQKWTKQEEIYATADYMKPSFSKYLFMLRASNSDQYIYSFFPMRRTWESLYDLDKIQETMVKKASNDYSNPDSDPFYAGKGFGTKAKGITDWDFFFDADYQYFRSINPALYIDSDWCEDLQKIIEFCKKNQIELTLFSAPMPDFLLSSVHNYDDYVTIVRSLLKETGVSYWDFNLCREAYFPSDSTLFYNQDHLNAKGSELFSTLFARFIKGEITPEELFYDSYEEKLRHLEPTIFGVTFLNKSGEAGTTFRSCHIVSNPAEGMEFQITIQPAEGEPCLIRDYETNTEFPLTEDGAGKILIRWRVRGKPDSTGERIINFPEKS